MAAESISTASPRAGASDDCGNGLDQDFQIEEQRPVIDVFEVEFDPLVEVFDLVAAADLPEAGQAGLHGEAAALRGAFKLGHLIERERARADEAHVAAQHVEELR